MAYRNTFFRWLFLYSLTFGLTYVLKLFTYLCPETGQDTELRDNCPYIKTEGKMTDIVDTRENAGCVLPSVNFCTGLVVLRKVCILPSVLIKGQ